MFSSDRQMDISDSSVTFRAEKTIKTSKFQGPYKQYMGRSKATGNLTIVLYEDPPDNIPKIHVRSSRYMAWIAENNLPVHLHAEKASNVVNFLQLGFIVELFASSSSA